MISMRISFVAKLPTENINLIRFAVVDQSKYLKKGELMLCGVVQRIHLRILIVKAIEVDYVVVP